MEVNVSADYADLLADYADLLAGSYDCVDRIVLNAYDPLCSSPGGFRTWWRRLHDGSDEDLDTTHLMRLAGRFARRVRASAKAHGIPVIECAKGERKHEIAEGYLREHPDVRGLFLILVARAVAPVWDVERTGQGAIRNLKKKQAFVNHYSFHIMDPEWGHVTLKLSGHPPFGAQVILNGHEYVAAEGAKQGLVFGKDGNCFTQVEDVAGLARIADTFSEPRIVGRLSQLCDRWIYSACLCYALDLEEQKRSGFRYTYSVYQVEYSRNLLFTVGGQMEQLFQDLVDRNRARLDLRQIRTIFGAKHRHLHARTGDASRVAAVLERPVYSLTVFKLHFGKLTFKGYTKGEQVLRFETIAHNTKELGCGRVLAKFPLIVARLKAILERGLRSFQWLDRAFVADDTLERLPAPSQVGNTRVGGIDIGKPRMRTVLAAVLASAPAPSGFTVGELAAKVQEIGGHALPDNYSVRQAAYDLKKLRGKDLVSKVGRSRRYQVLPAGVRTIAGLVILRDQILKPLLAAVANPLGPDPARLRQGRKPKHWTAIDDHYQTLRITMHALLEDLHLAAA